MKTASPLGLDQHRMPSPPAFSTGLARERQFVEYMETRRIEPQSPSSPQLTLRYSQLPPAMVGDRGGGGDLHLDDLLRPLLAQWLLLWLRRQGLRDVSDAQILGCLDAGGASAEVESALSDQQVKMLNYSSLNALSS